MSENPPPGKFAADTAEKVLAAIYGEDLLDCRASLDEIAGVIQEGMNSQGADERALVEALIEAIRNIDLIATPPPPTAVNNIEEVASILSQRTDAIRQISAKVLAMWEKLKPQG